MPFYELTIDAPDFLERMRIPFEADDDQGAVRDALAYIEGAREAFPGDRFDRVAVHTLEIGRFDKATRLIETTTSRVLHDSADPDASITVYELPAADLLAKVGGADPFAPTRPHADAVSLGLAHGQRPDERGLVAAHAVTADAFEEFESDRLAASAAARWDRKAD
jgi:hypothetical protein